MRIPLWLIPSLMLACGVATDEDQASPPPLDGKADSSPLTTFWTLEWDGAFVTQIQQHGVPSSGVYGQVEYLVGALHEVGGAVRQDALKLTNRVVVDIGGGEQRTTYHAELPMAWSKGQPPESLGLVLPARLGVGRAVEFSSAYARCVDPAYTPELQDVFWYYFRPGRCVAGGDVYRENGNRDVFKPADVERPVATIRVGVNQARDTYPEYHKIWEDRALNIIALFGSAEVQVTEADVGVRAYGDFYAQVLAQAHAFGSVEVSPELTGPPGPADRHVRITSTASDGRILRVDMLFTLVPWTDLVPGEPLFPTYQAASTRADLIMYNGHAAYGMNIRALAQAGSWVQGQYVIMFENGCDTFGYSSQALYDAHAAVNPDDPKGTKHLDEVLNAAPAYFVDMAHASMQFVTALLNPAQPRSYDAIMRAIAPEQLVLVLGDEDNTFQPRQ